MSTTTYPMIEMSDPLANAMQQAKSQHRPVLLTRDGKTEGVLIAFENDDDCHDWQLENDPRLFDLLDQRQAHADAAGTMSVDEVRTKLGL